MPRMRPESPRAAFARCLKKPAGRGSAGGFTLIEMIVVMTITSILVAIVAVFIQRPMEGVIDGARRAGLADAADTAARRLRRDIQRALPNSVRVQTVGSTTYLEFIPVLAAGRYCAEVDCGSAPLDTALGNATLSFVGPAPALSATTGTAVVIYNLGAAAGVDAYAGNNVVGLTSIGTNVLNLSGTMVFPLSSPGNRFFIVGAPVSYVCAPSASGGTLTRVTGYGRQASQPTPTGGNLLADHVSACRVDYQQAVIDQNGLLYLTLQLSQNGESVSLTHAIQINNVP